VAADPLCHPRLAGWRHHGRPVGNIVRPAGASRQNQIEVVFSPGAP